MQQPPPPGTPPEAPTEPHPAIAAAEARYWQRSVRLALALLAVWFGVSFGCGIVFREALDQYKLPGTEFPLGFWFAQQGAILVFVVLIAIYVVLAGRLDDQLDAERREGANS